MTDLSTIKNLHVITHPLVQHKLTLMRNKQPSTCPTRRSSLAF